MFSKQKSKQNKRTSGCLCKRAWRWPWHWRDPKWLRMKSNKITNNKADQKKTMLSAFFRFVRCMCMCVCVYLDMCTCLGIHWIVMFQYLLCRPTESPLRNQTSNRFYSTFCVCCKKKKETQIKLPGIISILPVQLVRVDFNLEWNLCNTYTIHTKYDTVTIGVLCI